ncbi:T9SS type A sorting domain-containing protein [Psychroserpens sp. XS_ASV72]|uniref:T9SS type A sorting domain-containing protein n=1 Tax=Psychroserpens sp. XS_ASV72 TaxID=3241293 RepID=UPI003517CF2B
MKKKLLIFASIIVVASTSIGLFLKQDVNKEESDTIAKLRKQHEEFLANSPFKETQKLSKKERKALGLPPNAYYEQMWELTMDPSTGRPMPENLLELQKELRGQRMAFRGSGGEPSNPWVNRGPNNQGGRTRGIMFDPNDVGNANPADDYTRVFAGGVSGGLWVNEDITDANSSWTLVSGVQENISVTAIAYDPNDLDTFYIASGESYVSGNAVGRGVWKSEDGGASWSLVFGNGVTSITTGGQSVNGVFYVNDILVRDNNGTSEVYAAISSTFYASAGSPNNFNGLDTMGLYKSTDGGVNWSRFNITFGNGTFKNPNDIELDINNNIWFSTTSTPLGNPGGDIYKSTDGITFTLENTITGASRTEIEPSSTDANRFWIAANVGGQGNLYTTTDAFGTINVTNEPNDADNGISATDYTRGQAFYNLPIEADENNNLYVGGIDLFTSANNGISWTQISKWSNNPGLSGLNVPLVHADHHAIVFRPGTNGSEVVFGTDGGVYYSSNVAAAVGNTNAIQSRNKDYVTTQFYFGSINPAGEAGGDDMAGGTQDNGTQFINNAVAGLNPFSDFSGGDGGYTEIDDLGSYVIQSYTGNTHVYRNFPSFGGASLITTQTGGSFINTAELDKNLNILYSDASSGGTFRIERTSEFLPGGAATDNTFLTNGLLNSTPTAMKISPYISGSSYLLVGLRNGRLLGVNFANFAPTFVNLTGPGFVGSISDIEYGQSQQEIFVTMHNYGVQSIWFTDDGGSTWRSLEGNLPEVPVKCILQNPLIPGEVIIGTELGVWATPDYTQVNPNWVQTYNGMSDVTVLDLDLRASDNTILASTHGRGMFTGEFTAIPLSVTENQLSANSISVFPTISNGDITIASKNNLGDAIVDIYDINGMRVYNSEINFSNSNVPLSLNLTSGMYFVSITIDNHIETKKIIIK